MKNTPEFGDLPSWLPWIAQHLDGICQGYGHEPDPGDIARYENEVGRSLRLAKDAPNRDWQTTLCRF